MANTYERYIMWDSGTRLVRHLLTQDNSRTIRVGVDTSSPAVLVVTGADTGPDEWEGYPVLYGGWKWQY